MVAERYRSCSRHVGFRAIAFMLLGFMVITLLGVSSPTFANDIAEEAVSTSSSSIEELLTPEGESPTSEDSETTSDASADASADPTDGNEQVPQLATEPAYEPSEASLQSDEAPIATQPEEDPAPPAENTSTSSTREEEEAELSLAADEDTYTGGTIPILRFTFLDDVDPDTGDVISILEAPERDGYTFRYWKGSRYQPGDKYTVCGDHTFTAVWKQDAKKSEGSHEASNSKNASSSTTKGKTAYHASSKMPRTPRTGDETNLVLLFISLGVAALVFAGARSMRSRS